MNLLVPGNQALLLTTGILSLIALIFALRFAPWRQLFADETRQHLFLGACVVLACFWQLQVEVRGLIGLHPTLITALCLTLGWSLSLLAGLSALIIETLMVQVLAEGRSWQVLPFDYLMSVVIPASFCYLVLRALELFPKRNLFFYLWGAGFFSAMISCQLIGVISLLIFWSTDNEVLLSNTLEHYLLFTVLMFPEGFSSGALITVMAMFKPHWLKTFADDFYFRKQP